MAECEAGSSARRRRERRLRSFWRHEQMAIQISRQDDQGSARSPTETEERRCRGLRAQLRQGSDVCGGGETSTALGGGWFARQGSAVHGG